MRLKEKIELQILEIDEKIKKLKKEETEKYNELMDWKKLNDEVIDNLQLVKDVLADLLKD